MKECPPSHSTFHKLLDECSFSLTDSFNVYQNWQVYQMSRVKTVDVVLQGREADANKVSHYTF